MCENENLISNYWNLCDANPLSAANLVLTGRFPSQADLDYANISKSCCSKTIRRRKLEPFLSIEFQNYSYWEGIKFMRNLFILRWLSFEVMCLSAVSQEVVRSNATLFCLVWNPRCCHEKCIRKDWKSDTCDDSTATYRFGYHLTLIVFWKSFHKKGWKL